MACDEELAERIRELIAAEPGVSERRMFGGLAFMVDGHMAMAASGRGGLMVRVEPVQEDALLAEPGAEPMVMRGRPMTGWLRIDADRVRTTTGLEPWVRHGVAYARSLPPR